jgi:molybdopterin-guanine dinucleotide biosynthesis protein A
MKAALILAGGKAIRLDGEGKAFVMLRGKPLLQWVIESIAPCVDVLYLSGNDDLSEFGYPVIQDELLHRGPLSGFHAAFSQIDAEYTFVTGCDMPFINPEVVQYLFEKVTGYSCCLPQENQYTEPLCCVYNTADVKTCIPSVIEEGNKRIWNLIECLPNPRYIPFEEIKKIDPCLLSFKNINTFKDLEYAETLIDKGGRK